MAVGRLLLAISLVLSTFGCKKAPDELRYGIFHPDGNWPTNGQTFYQPIPLTSRRGVSVCADYAKTTDAKGYIREMGRHPGIDFCGHTGTNILAAARGRVQDYTTPAGGLGLKICHEPRLVLDEYLSQDDPNYGLGKELLVCTAYEHLSQKMPAFGIVERGDIIGKMGRTGNYAGPLVHLHFEVLWGINHTNPHLFWAGGPGDMTCFDPDAEYPRHTLKLTLPVPCK